MTRLGAGTGRSTLADAAAAGRQAATSALSGLGGSPPSLVIVFVSIRYDLAALVAGIREVTGDAPVVGATSCGTFTEGHLIGPDTAGVCVAALAGGPYRFGTASQAELRTDTFEKGKALARAAREDAGPEPSPHAAMILLADGSNGADLQQLLNGLYRVTGASVPLVGGIAGDDRRLGETFVIHDGQVMTNAAVAVHIASPHPLRVGCGHGWEPISPPLMVTQSNGFIVERIAGRPARQVCEEYSRVDGASVDDASVDTSGIWRTEYALGLIEPGGNQLIRAVLPHGEESMRTFLPLPPYAAVQVVTARADALLAAVAPVVETTMPGPGEAGVLIAFSCTARYDLLGDRAAREAELLQTAAGDSPVIGFYTYGEFARTVGVSGVHNATLTAIAL
jgi:hypothetical protein